MTKQPSDLTRAVAFYGLPTSFGVTHRTIQRFLFRLMRKSPFTLHSQGSFWYVAHPVGGGQHASMPVMSQ